MPDRELPSEVVARELRIKAESRPPTIDVVPVRPRWLLELADRLDDPRLHLLPEGTYEELVERVARALSHGNRSERDEQAREILSALHIEEEKEEGRDG